MSTGFVRTVVATVGLLLAAGVAAQPGQERTVRIAGSTYLGDFPTFVADRRGLFARHGLAATVEYNDSGKRNLARLRAGEADFALMTLTPVVLDRIADPDPLQPDDPVILASLLQSYELTSVIATPGSGIEQPSDLPGRSIAVGRGTSAEFVWWLFKQFHGLDDALVTTVSIPFSETSTAMVSGRVSAAVLVEPWASRVEADFRRLGKPAPKHFDTRSMYAGRWVIVTTRDRVREHSDLCHDVLAAYREAIEFIEDHPDEVISIYTGNADGSNGVLPDRWEALDYDINLDWALIASLQEQLHWARNSGDPVEAVGVLEFLAPEPLREIWPEAVQIPPDAGRGGTR